MAYPQPRLHHIRPGEQFILRGETKLRTLIETDRHHGYFTDGYASLCHVLDPVNLEWGPDGWRPRRGHKPESMELAECLDVF